MSRSPSLLTRVAARTAAWGIRGWMHTLDYRGVFHAPEVDPIHASPTPRIYVFWHEYLLVPLYLRGHCDLTMLLSKHRDADILALLADRMGFECVRGSTYNGAASALRELTRRGRHRHLTITPDGPRGPRRQLAQGPIFLASRLQLPLVALGFGVDRPWRAKSWDRFAVPRPYSRVRAIVSKEMFIEPDLPREALEERRQSVERLLNDYSDEAQQWAETGAERADAMHAQRQGRPLPVAEVA